MKEHAEAMQAWEADDLRHQSELAKWKKEATNKGATTEAPEAPQMPICPRAWIEDGTTEKLASLLKEIILIGIRPDPAPSPCAGRIQRP